jgi:uncharacterized protein (TIGR00730 family)
MKRICVFCGSSSGSRPEYGAATEELGTELARRNIGLVYDGGNVGLMGVLADAVLRAGGEAVGVIPKNLMAREVGHKGLTKLHLVHSMHERKALMADLSDAFVALPGGFGTLEEFCEAVTWTARVCPLNIRRSSCRISDKDARQERARKSQRQRMLWFYSEQWTGHRRRRVRREGCGSRRTLSRSARIVCAGRLLTDGINGHTNHLFTPGCWRWHAVKG